MYQFQDYFDETKKDVPYTVPGEELEDYLRLLDMMLENYLEFKGLGSQGRLFSRGLVITESELSAYFDMPPYFRVRDICSPVLAAESDAAFDYIASRVEATLAENQNDKSGFIDNIATELLRIETLKRMFDLDRTELIAVLLALSVEIDRRYERIFGFLQDDVSKGTPTIGLLYALMSRITPRQGAEETIPEPPDERMYTYFFIRRENQEGLLHEGLVLQPLMKKLLKGDSNSGKTQSVVFHAYEEKPDITLFFEESYRELMELEKNGSGNVSQMIYLAHEDEETVLHLLFHCCSELQHKLFVLDLPELLALQKENRELCLSELLIRLKLNNAWLAIRYVPAKEKEDVLLQTREIKALLQKICLENSGKNIFLYGEKEEPGELAAQFIPFIRIPDSPVALRTEIWGYFLNTVEGIRIAEDVNVPDLADCYEIPYGKIHKVTGHAVATARIRLEPVIDRALILDSFRQMNRVDFSGLATYVKASYTWDDITITEMQHAVMKTACDRYRLRNRIGEGWGLKRKNAYGNGVSILLYGPPGTGKTMAAQVIANELGLPLYRVDISQISSKYIGETEKNLAVIFAAAAKANVILFFDEADALFSKRTSVGDSHDKYANAETAYLLQKIEEYDGMSILSTNYYNNFDDAFIRRITYSVHMEQPDKDTRYALWKTILPESAEMSDDIDFRFLADKFELSGSNIKAILFNAAYMAGAENKPIGMEHIVRSMEYEYNKLGKLVNKSEFGKYDKYLRT